MSRGGAGGNGDRGGVGIRGRGAHGSDYAGGVRARNNNGNGLNPNRQRGFN